MLKHTLHIAVCLIFGVSMALESNAQSEPNPVVACDCFDSDSIKFPKASDGSSVPKNEKDGTSVVEIRITGKTADGCDTVQVTVTVTGKSGAEYTVTPNMVSASGVKDVKATITDLEDGPYKVAIVDEDGNECQSAEFDFDCDDCSEGSCPAGGGDTSQGSSVRHTIMMGKSFQGDVTLPLVFYSKDVRNPGIGALDMQAGAGITINRDANDHITSVITDTTEAVVSPIAGSDAPQAFQVELKHRANGATGDLFQTTVFENIGTGQNMVMRFSTTKDGKTEVADYKSTEDQTGEYFYWTTLTRHNGLWRETLKKKYTTDNSQRIVRTITEHRKSDGINYEVVSDVEETYTYLAKGERITKQVDDPGGAALTTTWEYWDTGEDTSSSGNGSTVGLGKEKRTTSPDGRIEEHYYEAGLEITNASYAGDPQGITTETVTNLAAGTTTTSKVGDAVLSQTQTERGKDAQTHETYTIERTYMDGSDYLESRTDFYPVGQDFGGQPRKTTSPDGTVTIYERGRSGGNKITTTYKGVPDGANISEGTKTVRTVNEAGKPVSEITTAMGAGAGTVLSHQVVIGSDDYGRPLSIGHFPDGNGGYAYTTGMTYNCCGIESETDRYGVTTYRAYDDMERVIKTNRLGVSTATKYDGLTDSTHRYAESPATAVLPDLSGATASNMVAKTVNTVADTVTESWTRSAADGMLIRDRLTTTTYLNPASAAPATLPAGIGKRVSIQTADSFTQITDYHPDGKTYQTYGDLSPAIRYGYSVNATGLVEIRSYVDDGILRETTTSQSDWAGRTLRVTYIDGAFATMHYNSKGQLVRTVDPDEIVTLYAYNAEGERTTTATDLSPGASYNDEVDNIAYGTDTVQFSETIPSVRGGIPVWRTTTKVWYTDEVEGILSPVVSQSDRTPDGLRSWSWQIGQGSTPDAPTATFTTSVTTLSGNDNWTEKTTSPDGTYTLTTYVDGLMDITGSFGSDNTLISTTAMRDSTNAPLSGYDEWNRPTHRRNSRTGVTTTEYLSGTSDVVKSVTDPGNLTTAFTYDLRGRQTGVTLPDTTVTTTTYTARGEVAGRSGSQTYPVAYTYDYAGRQLTITTYGTVTATTGWIYSEDRGFLVEKNYPGETDDGITDRDHTHTAAGRPLTRTWESGVVTTYGYDGGGRLETVTYANETNGHTTPDHSYTYDALGRIKNITRGGVLHAKNTYRTSDLQRLAEAQQIDTLDQAVTYTYEGGANGTLGGRPNGYSFAHGAAIWSYDSAGRPSTVTDGTDTFAYGYRYTLNGVLHEGTTASGQGIESNMPFTLNGPQVGTTLAYDTTRNALAFRKNDIAAGTLSRFAYGVNDIGQRDSLTPTGSAFANNTPFAWGYNGRGELTSATRTGSPTFERAYSYDGIGNRLTATDENGATTSYFANTGGNTAGGNALNQYASISYPGSNTLEPVHDADGNLTGCPVPGVNGLSPGVPIPANATLTWDAENRLAKAVVNSATIHYEYDHQSRLIARKEGSATVRYLYDGWNRIAEYCDNGSGLTLQRCYLWGMDLSGGMQSAGGVGGLLSMMTVNDTSPATFYPTYDGNGNVSEYVDESGGKAAHFEYDPFGNLTVDSEDNAEGFPYRFSSKPQDPVTGLYYYGYRFYDPVTGRWPSRDPIGEEGGINLYGFVSNKAVGSIDILGLKLNHHVPEDFKVEPVPSLREGRGYTRSLFKATTHLPAHYLNFGNVSVFVNGDLSIEAKSSNLGDKATTDYTIMHEFTHIKITVRRWNMIADEINYLEREWCKPCYKLAMEYGNSVINLRSIESSIENNLYDMQEYPLRGVSAAEINRVKKEYAANITARNAAVTSYNKDVAAFYKSCIKGAKYVPESPTFISLPIP